MNKRQRKKKLKKYLPIIADEVNLLTMTDNEREKAIEDFKKFKEKFAYRKKYRDLKEGKALSYFFPVGQRTRDFIIGVSKVARKSRNTIKGTQNMEV